MKLLGNLLKEQFLCARISRLTTGNIPIHVVCSYKKSYDKCHAKVLSLFKGLGFPLFLRERNRNSWYFVETNNYSLFISSSQAKKAMKNFFSAYVHFPSTPPLPPVRKHTLLRRHPLPPLVRTYYVDGPIS